MSIVEESLFVNEAFYQAFRERDLRAMDELWARESPVACIHPGWAAIVDRDDIMRSWQGIFESPQAPEIHCRRAHAYPLNGAGLVICYEEMANGLLVATNLFRRETGGLRIMHHQAGPSNAPLEDIEQETDDTTVQ